jgi:hypothetical protein
VQLSEAIQDAQPLVHTMLRLVTEGCEGLIAGQRLLIQAFGFLSQTNGMTQLQVCHDVLQPT